MHRVSTNGVLGFFLLAIGSVYCQKRLYYTGKYKNEDTNSVNFAGAKLSSSVFFEHTEIDSEGLAVSNSSFLFSGGTFLRLKHINTTVNSEFLDFIKLEVMSTSSDLFKFSTAVFYKQLSSYDYGLASSEDGFDPNNYLLEAEIGLYDHSQDIFLEKYWREISGGELIAVSAITTAAQQPLGSDSDDQTETDSTSAASPSASTAGRRRHHRVVFSSDYLSRKSVISHTWFDEAIPHATEDVASAVAPASSTGDKSSKGLRVMTYNLWHNNPPSWIYHDKRYEYLVGFCLTV